MTDPLTIDPITDPAAARSVLEDLDRAARHWQTPCGDGTMVWRGWGSGPVVLLMHGGAGSWRHWARNIGVLSREFTVIVPDLPGLGDSANAPEPVDADSITAIVSAGLATVIGTEAPVHIAAFSFGGVIAGVLAARLGDRLRSLTLSGSGGFGPPNRGVAGVRVRGTTGEERLAAHRENLLRIMLAHPENVDALAMQIQDENAHLARLNSGAMWMSRAAADAMPLVRGHVHGVWGELEMENREMLDVRIELLRAVRPDAEMIVFPNVGHWAFYEAAEEFNATFLRILKQ